MNRRDVLKSVVAVAVVPTTLIEDQGFDTSRMVYKCTERYSPPWTNWRGLSEKSLEEMLTALVDSEVLAGRAIRIRPTRILFKDSRPDWQQVFDGPHAFEEDPVLAGFGS